MGEGSPYSSRSRRPGMLASLPQRAGVAPSSQGLCSVPPCVPPAPWGVDMRSQSPGLREELCRGRDLGSDHAQGVTAKGPPLSPQGGAWRGRADTRGWRWLFFQHQARDRTGGTGRGRNQKAANPLPMAAPRPSIALADPHPLPPVSQIPDASPVRASWAKYLTSTSWSWVSFSRTGLTSLCSVLGREGGRRGVSWAGLLGVCTDADTRVHESSQGPEPPVLGRLEVSQTRTEALGAQNRYRQVRWCGKVGQKTQNLKPLSLGHMTPWICVILSTEAYCPSGVDTVENPTLLILTHTEPRLGEGRSNCRQLTGEASARGRDSALQGPREVRAKGKASAVAVSCLGDKGSLQRETKG